MKLSDLKNKKILILGFAREGKDTLLFLRKKFPGKKFGIADQKLSKDYLKKIGEYDVIIKSPGIPQKTIAPFLKRGQIITSQTDIFLENCEGMVIGVTGTKGKSTTSSLIYEVLRKGGVRAHLIGNIGKPVLAFLERQNPKDVFVYELSSFQLENLTESPHIAVLLNLYSEHLDHHGNLKKYIASKENIAKYQKETDFLVYNAKDPLVLKIAKLSKAQKLPYAFRPSLHPWIASAEPARIIGKLFGINEKTIEQAIRTFKPLPHRLEPAGKYKGITFYNDSLATIPEAAIAALNALGQKVSTLIAGGFDRGVNPAKLAKRIEKSNIKTLILFPDTGKKIIRSMKKRPLYFFAKDMKEAVKLCYKHTKKGTICLLSPAASSFNMFKDYRDRGEQFKKFVKLYGKDKKA
ncbi:MAG: UDP-N-acetylmuramoyl-L-alanine--D-glutamate ligase [Candidatus Wildermuthbacteria bacterium]|nr:UDP-N-acetylmuramoyl-L-alanine--D-glutamate ligase [Candidatus Wildermuthbacteria bacterium]